MLHGGFYHLASAFPRLPDAQAPDGIAGETDLDGPLSRFFSENQIMPPWTMPKRDCIFSGHVGTAALGCPSARRAEFWSASPAPRSKPVELRSAGQTRAAVPT